MLSTDLCPCILGHLGIIAVFQPLLSSISSDLGAGDARSLRGESDSPGQPLNISDCTNVLSCIRRTRRSWSRAGASAWFTVHHGRLTASSNELRMCGSGPPSMQSMNDETSEKNGSSS
jgi:hypothetical protein